MYPIAIAQVSSERQEATIPKPFLRANHWVFPKAAETLLVLVEYRVRPVGKDEFMNQVWEGVIVEESNLTEAISKLRKALEDDPQIPKFIETVPRRG